MFGDLDFSPGKVVYNDFDISKEKPLSEQIYSLKEDLFQVNYDEKYIIDIGWHPEFTTKGNFKICVIKDFDWANPVFIKKTKDLEKLKSYMVESISVVNEYIREGI
jgi:hypothetical protein